MALGRGNTIDGKMPMSISTDMGQTWTYHASVFPPTDGIPTVRPNLGTIFVPALAGQKYVVQDGRMPWVGGALSRDAIRAARDVPIADADLMRLAEGFYRVHAASGETRVAAYHPDTQGVFDIAHLLYGDDIFLDMMNPEGESWIDGLLEISLDLMVRAMRRVKHRLGEPDGAMIHGHATPQGVYFPDAGIRISEDTATLISPAAIERFVLPMIEKAAAPFGGAFVHFCGRHSAFFDMLCRMPCVRAIDLGNPEMYDTRRPAEGDEPFLRPEIGFTPRWYHESLALDFGRRWHTDVRYRREAALAMRRELRRRFAGTRIGGIDRSDGPLDLLTGVFGACTVTAMFGLPILYAADNWPDVERRYRTRAQIACLETPDLDINPVFEDLLQQVDQIESLEGQTVGFINWQGILNSALRLRGQELFTDLYEAPPLCHRLFDILCDTMIEAIRRLHERQQAGGDYRFATISNCSVNMISPAQYEEFLLPYDLRMAAAFKTLGVHNCAWNASPYLDLYATIPNLGYIDMGIRSDLAKARSLMPNARRALMYTPMDLANKPLEAIRADLERAAREYAPCDIVLADIDTGIPDERILQFVEWCAKLSE